MTWDLKKHRNPAAVGWAADPFPPRAGEKGEQLKLPLEPRPAVGAVPAAAPTTPSAVAVGTGEVRITDPKTGGQKGQKPERYDLFPFDALDEVARVYGVGAKKYSDDNWLKGYSWRLSLGALLRHVSRFAQGEDRDAETGCLHLALAAWHCFTLLTFYMRSLGTDDRKPPRIRRTWEGP